MAGFGVVIFTGILSFISLFFIAICAAAVVYILFSYIFQGISIMCMGKHKGYKVAFTAWIPFYRQYLLGKIAGNKIIGGISGILSFASVCLGTCFCMFQKAGIALLAAFVISSMAAFILDAIIAHNIYRSRSSKYGELLTVFHILSFGLLKPIFLFAHRNKPEQEPANI